MGCEMSSSSSAPEPYETAKAAAERDLAYVERLKREDPERCAKVQEATRRRLGFIDAKPSASSPEAAPTTAATKLSEYDFPFENLVFEGGGSKGRIYSGALKCLRDAGIKARRFAGSSIGAMTAALMAVNATPEEIDEIMSKDLNAQFTGDDSSWTCCLARLLKILNKYGIHDSDKFFDFFGKILKQKTGNADVTFYDVWEQFGSELCVTALNVNLMTIVYFHPKTTPSTPVRTAVRMSMSIPGLFTPVSYSFAPGYTDNYVDGGVLCNYPIHVFDGWWLSMNLEDSYIRKLRPLETLLTRMNPADRFGTFNKKTLGFVVYSHDENQDMRPELDKRIADLHIPRPDTPLYRKRAAEREHKGISIDATMFRVDVTNRFIDTLLDFIQLKDDQYYISHDQFTSMFKNLKPKAESSAGAFTTEDANEIFGEKYDASALFHRADTKKQGEVRLYKVLLAFENELNIHAIFLARERKETTEIKEYWGNLLGALLDSTGKICIQTPADLDRTVGLYTDYVGTLDFNIDSEDRQFLNEQGYKTTELFLRDYISKNNLKPRTATA